MNLLRPPLRLLGAGLLALSLLTVAAWARTDRKFTTPPVQATEAQYLMQLLEQAHYNRDAVSPPDFLQVIPGYMGDLDGQRLFFLNSDKAAFTDKYSKNIYWNIRELGNINAAYDIFDTYVTRTEARINWIFDELKGDFDLSANETYRADRSKSDWPANPAAADALWRQRLKFELIAELMNKKTIEQAKETVRKRYERMLKNLEDIEAGDLAELFLTNVAKLYDPHSTYFSAATYEDFGIQMKLQLVGIGALLGLEEDTCVVREVVPGGPVDVGKQLRPGDKIISVAQPGGEPVEVIGMKLRKIVEMIRGGKGTQVRLVIQPADATDPSIRREVTITRDVVKLNSARAHAAIFETPLPGGGTVPIGVIKLPTFYGPSDDDTPDAEKTSATKDVARLIEQLKAAGIQGMVLDLRRNGGGFLSEAIDLAGLFIKSGPVVQVKNYAGEVQVDRAEGDRIAYDGPLAVLVDRFSASASEIVAGALQNYGRAIVVGDSSTHGKGTVQTVVEMRRLAPKLAYITAKTGAAKFTVQKYYLPNGASTQLKGVVPDIVLPSIEDYLPIGEADLPRALVWDEIPGTKFAGQPLGEKILRPLREASTSRQTQLPEFSYLRRNVDWFKMRQSQKLIALNLEERRRQKEADDEFRKEMKAEKERLAQQEYPIREFHLGPKPAPKAKAPAKAEAADTDGTDDETELSTDESDSYPKVDVHLRESLRVVSDAVALGRNRELWASDHPPLSAQADRKG